MKSFNKNQHFDNSYKTNDILQKDFNSSTIESYAEIIYTFYISLGEKKHPMAIIDLCCGYGKPTFDLYNKLSERSVEIEKIVGYDISKDMIKSAQDEYKDYYPELIFKEQDVEMLNDQEHYDIAISLFGFHWMDNIQEVASKVFESLKIPGKLMFFVPLEKMDLYSYREDFINNSKWNECFLNMQKLKPFIENKDDYVNAFAKYFQSDKEQEKLVEKNYTTLEFVKFLSSWMQEVRHLCADQNYSKIKDVISNSYVTEFVNFIPELTDGNIIKAENEMIIYTEHTFSYEGSKVDPIGNIQNHDVVE